MEVKGLRSSNKRSYSSYGPISTEDQTNRPLKVVITGGCGFLGRHIAKSLYNEFKEVRITLMDVNPADTAVMKFITDGVPLGQPVSFGVVDKDVTRLPHLLKVFKGADVVFHCASKTDALANATKLSLVNIDGTRNVIRACKECGVTALIYTGSLMQSLKAGVTTQHGISENTYEKNCEKLVIPGIGESKNEAEKLVLESNDGSLYTCSIRCPPLFGEFDKVFIPSAVSIAKTFYGFYPNCGDPNIRMTAMYAGNAAWAHVCAAKKLLDPLARKLVTGKFFYVGDGTPSESYTSFFMRFLGPLGYSRAIRIPVFVLEVFLYLTALVVIFLSLTFDFRSSALILNFQRHVKMVSISHTLVWSRAQSLLGYKPKYTFDKAIEYSMKNWYCNLRMS